MAHPSHGYTRFHDTTLSNPTSIPSIHISQDHTSPSSPSSSSQQQNTTTNNVARSNTLARRRRSRRRSNIPPGASSLPDDNDPASVQLVPRRSLIMKHRLRRLNDFYEDQQEQQELQQYHQPISKPLPPLPSEALEGRPQEEGEDEGTGVGRLLSIRRGGSQYGKSQSARRWDQRQNSRGASSQPNAEEMDTSGLLNYIPEEDEDGGGDGEAKDPSSRRAGFGRTNNKYLSPDGQDESIELQETPQDTSEKQHGHHHHHHRKLGEILHGERPDRHLFPYRTWPENKHALLTFFRRFFFILLILPAWIIPNVMTGQDHGGQGDGQEEGGGGAAEGGGEHGVMLSKWVNMAIFVLNLLAMMHLGKAAGACMEELVPKLGMSIVSIFDAMTSSSVELAVAAFALRKGLVRVVQAAMLGAILNNLLLMMGITFVVGGFYHNQQEIQTDTSQTGMNLLMIVCISYVVPVALDVTFWEARINALPDHLTQAQLAEQRAVIRHDVDKDIWDISKFMAIHMLILYGCCLVYQYNSRSFMVTPEAKHTEAHTVHRRHVHYWFAGWGYGIMLSAQIYSANLLVHAVEALGKQFHLNDSFVGFVLLPIVLISDLQEEVIAIKESRANRLDRSIALMIGSCMQIALLVSPLLVLLGWIMDVPLTFKFSVLEAAILAGAVLIVNYLLQDNETNWLEGCMLLAAFMMCAISFYYDIIPFEHGGGGGAGGHGPTPTGGADHGLGGGHGVGGGGGITTHVISHITSHGPKPTGGMGGGGGGGHH